LSSISEQRRISGGGTVASTGGVGFAGLIDVTVVWARPGRVCTAEKCFSMSAGNKSSLRSRIAFPHTDARERFNHFEICAADAVGQRPMSKEISWVVHGIMRTSPASWCSDEIRALGRGRGGGDLNQCGFLAGDAHTMKIETPFGKPAVWMYQF
jgi:hypothetical protein